MLNTAAAAAATLGLMLALSLQGCSGGVRRAGYHAPVAEVNEQQRVVRHVEHHHHEHRDHHKAKPKKQDERHPIDEEGDGDEEDHDFDLPNRTGPECPGFHIEAAYGYIHVTESRAGEFPTVVCPNDYEYRGPRIQCSWVDQLCQVHGQYDTVSPESCMIQYNLTFAGDGLTSWPEGVPPRLMKRGIEYNEGERDTKALPKVITSEQIQCERESFVDLDFEHSPVRVTYPPYTQDFPWYKSYEGITAIGEQKVDMRVTQVGSLDPPGNMWMDGNSSATGRININRTEESTLRFSFLEAGTLNPVVLNKFFFTVFDLDDGRDGMHNTKVTAGGMTEYYVSRRTCIKTNKTPAYRYQFFGDGLTSEVDSASVADMWLSSLERTVVFMFRDTSQFTLTVQAMPFPTGQVLEFAGWSELVDIGTKVRTQIQQLGDGKQVMVSSALSDQPLQEEVTGEFASPARSGGPLPAVDGPRRRWAAVAVIAAVATSALAAAAAVAALTQWPRERHRERSVGDCSSGIRPASRGLVRGFFVDGTRRPPQAFVEVPSVE